ncbi:hypothetical protein H5410_012577 [Solanum commersonii]|uniref:O-methyltransferase C-terminal domain-containing protein n=1 Tax=Solanum commersonii TaxID=4109 RepID=A0A9J6AT91_SOLCO|nr:hypothetical protein H5410_012577 [Solanum commersonii]
MERKNTSSLIFTYCKKQNHTIDNCYRLIGFPADFKFTKSKKFTQGAKTNVACAEDSGLQVGDRPMTQDQFHSLYQLLQNVKVGTEGEQTPMDTAAANCVGLSHPPLSKSPKSFISVSLSSISWILDSGASEHMTFDINLLSNITMLPKPVYVNLPNSTRVLVLQSDITSVPASISPSPHSLLQDPSVPLPDSSSTIPSPSTISIPTSDTLPVRKSTRLHHPPRIEIVGGGTGTVAKAVSNAFPELKCSVFDPPHVVEGLEGGNNLNYIGGDMFKSVPSAHAMLLKV